MVDYLLREGDLVGEGRSEARGLDGQDHGGCYGVRSREELKVEDAGVSPVGKVKLSWKYMRSSVATMPMW